ncbi:ABC-type nitrate/sulfonate/bicarbonate transport system, periplasmic component [uncultured Pleomorphomonas sp.]|uniref:ABC-type nitrate/sulfonate/bicarbonate transport system, periplasmic component n=1 Tax=uncultured Pleomorphomonas sp. TaxID=442121 RepID=A0A212LFN1_9HYPH|nr:ABC transporter substrate-binding protein [uncultured Pleomorphomonas sp.]SCM76355.1 ABC-type nitrate/sulfonate/bicarbonate transport system, periplasmic component [uncultured Pleomorphomonas sp.]
MTVLQQTNKLLAGIALAAGLISSGTLPASAETEVRINQAFQSLLYLPLYVAQEKGYFADEGLKVTISTGGGGAQSWAAVIGGSADFSIQDPVFVPKTRENGGDGVVVAAIQNAPTVFIIGKDGTPLQDNLAHLSGKRVIVSPQPDTTWAFMSYLIKQQTLENVKLVNVSIGNEVPAIVSDRADYALAVEPQVTQSIRQNGLSSVYSFSANKDWFPFAFSSLTTTKDYISKNPEAAQGVITAFEMASRYIYKDFDGTVEIAAKYFPNLPKEIVAEAVKREIDAKGYPENVLVTKTSWDNNLNIALYAKNVKAYPSEATSYENNVNVELATKAKDIADAKFK